MQKNQGHAVAPQLVALTLICVCKCYPGHEPAHASIGYMLFIADTLFVKQHCTGRLSEQRWLWHAYLPCTFQRPSSDVWKEIYNCLINVWQTACYSLILLLWNDPWHQRARDRILSRASWHFPLVRRRSISQGKNKALVHKINIASCEDINRSFRDILFGRGNYWVLYCILPTGTYQVTYDFCGRTRSFQKHASY